MQIFDLCLAWNWEYDADFVRLIQESCTLRGLTLLEVNPRTLSEVLPLLFGHQAGFRALLDRASEADPAYLPLVEIARSLGAHRLNPRELADQAYDKAALHQRFLEVNIPTPTTIILPAYAHHPELPFLDPNFLRGRVTVKPALGGGGEGVVTDVIHLEQVQSARAQFPEQRYLLQEHVTPKTLHGLPAWFRVIFCLGEIYASFWDTVTHIYTPLSTENPALADLHETTQCIARLCRLDLFSTEIAITEDNRSLVVDYVNDPIDLRLQSRAADGVPDFIVQAIAAKIAETVSETEPRFL